MATSVSYNEKKSLAHNFRKGNNIVLHNFTTVVPTVHHNDLYDIMNL